MTKLLSILALAAFLTIGGISSASAHCGGCGAGHAKAGEMKPCEKCVKSGKTCQCGKKSMKPCEKMLGEKKKPCSKRVCNKGAYKANVGTSATVPTQGNDKGSLVIRSGQTFRSSYNN